MVSLCWSQQPTIDETKTVSRIAFGSCLQQDKPQPIWNAISASKPDLFLWLGDNVYGDTTDEDVLRGKYFQLKNQPGYMKLRRQCRILGTWDDHDYGKNDAGVEFTFKEKSQQILLDFLDEPADSPRRKQAGVYASYLFGPAEQRVQIILLDTRYFRGPLKKVNSFDREAGEGLGGDYTWNMSSETTILGETQWNWLERQLLVPAKLRIIGSSIQVIARNHGYEKWDNFPHERERLFELIKKTKANGVILISGDRHSAEISRERTLRDAYPIYDVTSSSLNKPSKWRNELNEQRVGSQYPWENFGMILIDWTAKPPVVRMQVRDLDGKVVLQVRHPVTFFSVD